MKSKLSLSLCLVLFSVAGLLQAEMPRNPGPPDKPVDHTIASVPRAIPRFAEAWAYLLGGDEPLLTTALHVTDLAYFGASLNSYGELTGVPKPVSIKGFAGRRHLVLAIQDNFALTHMAIFPDFPVRAKLIDDLVQASQDFDGVQLDWESITGRDKQFFWSFLAELKSRLKGKILSVAIPARTSAIEDAFDYKALNAVADRIIVMAYDEHWSGSSPGSVASLAWCQKVAQFAQGSIDPDKLVMGVPFYGRAWADRSLSRAYKYSGVAKLMSDKSVTQPTRLDGIPSFEYDELVRVRVFYEDKDSQWARLNQYASLGVRKMAFWRLGQEDPEIWSAFQTD